jgi:hypothetical protein
MSLLYIENECDYVKDYYSFISKNLLGLNLKDDFALLGLQGFDTKNNKIIFINYEHNLVHPLVPYSPPIIGTTPLVGTEYNYLVRIEQLNHFLNCSYYIEYSQPNIQNIKSCSHLDQFNHKIIYIPPILCDYSPESECRDEYDVVTSFYILNPEGRPRRKILHDVLVSEIPKYHNIPKVFGDELYDNFYKKSKILVNIHQTDHHHTFEELRVLPALLNGLIVVAEDSPLKESIPYHEYIIWCKYEDIVSKTKEVLDNYDQFYDRIHGESSDLKEIISKMKDQLDIELKDKLTDAK